MVSDVESRSLEYDPHGVDNPSHGPSAVGAPFHGLRGYRLMSLESVTTTVTLVLIDRHRDLSHGDILRTIYPFRLSKAQLLPSLALASNTSATTLQKGLSSSITSTFAFFSGTGLSTF